MSDYERDKMARVILISQRGVYSVILAGVRAALCGCCGFTKLRSVPPLTVVDDGTEAPAQAQILHGSSRAGQLSTSHRRHVIDGSILREHVGEITTVTGKKCNQVEGNRADRVSSQLTVSGNTSSWQVQCLKLSE